MVHRASLDRADVVPMIETISSSVASCASAWVMLAALLTEGPGGPTRDPHCKCLPDIVGGADVACEGRVAVRIGFRLLLETLLRPIH